MGLPLAEVASRLAELIEVPGPSLQIPETDDKTQTGIINVGGHMFAIALRRSSTTATVASAIQQAKSMAEQQPGTAVPLVAVPYMGETGDELCTKAGVSWLDLSGNARIKVRGLRIWISGQPNRFKERGRPSTAFAPKSARIARRLLIYPEEAISQRDLANATGLDEGFTSRIVAKLTADGLVRRETDGRLRVQDPALLLEAWRNEYDFSKHTIIKGHLTARSGPELVGRLTAGLRGHALAMTGLAAAWRMTQFANFRLVTAYVGKRPDPALLTDLGFREEARGANTWLIVPNDGGVFTGARSWDGTRCVHPVQAYVDLKALPERAEEAAQQLRNAYLAGKLAGGATQPDDR